MSAFDEVMVVRKGHWPLRWHLAVEPAGKAGQYRWQTFCGEHDSGSRWLTDRQAWEFTTMRTSELLDQEQRCQKCWGTVQAAELLDELLKTWRHEWIKMHPPAKTKRKRTVRNPNTVSYLDTNALS